MTDLRTEFATLVREVTDFVGTRSLDVDLRADLNHRFGPGSPVFDSLMTTCLKAIDEGWMCDREAGGIRYGRVIKPAPEFAEFSGGRALVLYLLPDGAIEFTRA